MKRIGDPDSGSLKRLPKLKRSDKPVSESKRTLHELKTVTKPVTKKAYIHELTVLQLDALGLRIAGLPLANKDKDIFVAMLINELGISDTDRFWRHVREENVPTPKT